MSTNHRPTLESKKGKKRPIGDTIVHARTLPQQTTLKYRTDVPFIEPEEEAETVKRRLVTQEEKDEPSDKEVVPSHKDVPGDVVLGDKNVKDELNQRDEPRDEQDDNDKHDDNEQDKTDEVAKGDSEGDSGSGPDGDAGSDSDSSEFEDESDTEALLQELNKIKQEKEKKAQLQMKQNPLVDPEPKKKSWRSSTFKRDKSKPKDKFRQFPMGIP